MADLSENDMIDLIHEVEEADLMEVLFDACRVLLRYDGIDKKRVIGAIEKIDETVQDILQLRQHN